METPKKIETHQGHRQRLYTRFTEEGLDNFAEHEVLELLLFSTISRANTNLIAHQLIQRFGSFAKVLEADTKDLMSIKGMGEKSAIFLNLIGPVTSRYLKSAFSQESPKLNHPKIVGDYLKPLLINRAQEVFYVISLNSQCKVLHATLISEGTVNETVVYPRKVAEAAIRHKASSIILAHNHPAGTVSPSDSDIKLTKILAEVMAALKIPVLDHVIVAHDKVYSFAESGLL